MALHHPLERGDDRAERVGIDDEPQMREELVDEAGAESNRRARLAIEAVLENRRPRLPCPISQTPAGGHHRERQATAPRNGEA